MDTTGSTVIRMLFDIIKYDIVMRVRLYPAFWRHIIWATRTLQENDRPYSKYTGR